MNVEAEGATPAQAPIEAQAEAEKVEAVSTEATPEQTQVEAPEAAEEKAKKEPWFQKRIGELTRAKYEEKRLADMHAQEARELREQLVRMQQGEQVQTTQLSETAVEEAARRLLAKQTFDQKCNKVYQSGKAEFPDFDQAVSNLQMVGMPQEFLEFVTESDVSTKLIQHLGHDLDEAARIQSLPPVLMAKELTKLEHKLSQTSAKPVSKAPAPITPIAGTSGGSKAPSEMTDAEFAKWRKSQIAQRS